jgi:hypothetical protein
VNLFDIDSHGTELFMWTVPMENQLRLADSGYSLMWSVAPAAFFQTEILNAS